MIRGLGEAAKRLGIEVKDYTTRGSKGKENREILPDSVIIERIPMMYRAQVQGRCSLQFAGNNQDLEDWTVEWIDADDQGRPRYQYPDSNIGLENSIHRIKVEFPFRLFTNCGQDSIARPTLGKNGIPFIPGSSIKGLFRRGCNPAQATKYCGDSNQVTPGCLRFHGAYPVGDWANRIVDVVHPQQPRQVQGKDSATAYALISFYKPLMLFEFSSSDPTINWREVEWILLTALQQGIGGKTSTGYGVGGNYPGNPQITPNFPVNVLLSGIGVSSTLRNREPEFRLNLFKACLRGHTSRLLAGVCSREPVVEQEVKRLFGHTNAPSLVQLIWQSRSEQFDTSGRNPVYTVQGMLHLDAPHQDIEFIEQVVKFAFVMGGFGKSWRRVWHGQFYPTYHHQKFAIGCHWESPDIDDICTSNHLKQFLDDLRQLCCRRLSVQPADSSLFLPWKEAWHPKRLAVYSKVARQSSAITLFHDDIFKTTPAIGGRNPKDDRPKFISSVWHRMLPIGKEQYLEIVTVFHGDRTLWNHKQEGDQLQGFIQALKGNGLELTWGSEPQTGKKLLLPR